ncbi:hypothetical protein L1887_26497 [Cichorium endivia]|nr:hypothetical protein L1887_26497 [Cichorium endivia]
MRDWRDIDRIPFHSDTDYKQRAATSDLMPIKCQAKGLTFWAPNINVLREPIWGRAQETPGEDPSVVGDYSVSYVRGIQGDCFEGGKSTQIPIIFKLLVAVNTSLPMIWITGNLLID